MNLFYRRMDKNIWLSEGIALQRELSPFYKTFQSIPKNDGNGIWGTFPRDLSLMLDFQ